MITLFTETSAPPHLPTAAFSQNATTRKQDCPAGLSERRSEIRYPTCDEVRVWLNNMASREIPAIMRDVSRSGFRIELNFPVEPGARIKVCIPDRATLFAVTRYCRQTSDKYHVGASIESVYYPTAPAPAAHYMVASGTSAARTRRRRGPSFDSDVSSPECRDLARAIIDDHTPFPIGTQQRLPDLPPSPDRLT